MEPQVIPMPAPQPLRLGKDRAIAFGGGGEWFVCWTLAYCAIAQRLGTDLSTADVTVGTSAGSIVGSYVTAHQVMSAYESFQRLSANPAALERMIVTNTGAPSQGWAAETMRTAQSTDARRVRADWSGCDGGKKRARGRLRRVTDHPARLP